MEYKRFCIAPDTTPKIFSAASAVLDRMDDLREGRAKLTNDGIDLEFMSLARSFSQEMNFMPMEKARKTENGEITGVFIGLERIDDRLYASVPTFSAAEIKANPLLAWKQPDGLDELPAAVYQKLKDHHLGVAKSARPGGMRARA